MTDQTTAHCSPAEDPQTGSVSVNHSDQTGPGREAAADPTFEASLRYLAADLGEIARTAPAEKREPLYSVTHLLRAIANS